jgi:hypothetical protein
MLRSATTLADRPAEFNCPGPCPMVTVTRSTLIDVAPAAAWTVIRDFNAMPDWNDTVVASRIENGPADRLGCRRVLTFEDGGVWTHELTALSDAEMRLAYAIVGTPMPMRIPVWDYRAELAVTAGPVANTCRIEWRAEFATDHVAEMMDRAGQVFERGFAGLRRRLLA